MAISLQEAIKTNRGEASLLSTLMNYAKDGSIDRAARGGFTPEVHDWFARQSAGKTEMDVVRMAVSEGRANEKAYLAANPNIKLTPQGAVINDPNDPAQLAYNQRLGAMSSSAGVATPPPITADSIQAGITALNERIMKEGITDATGKQLLAPGSIDLKTGQFNTGTINSSSLQGGGNPVDLSSIGKDQVDEAGAVVAGMSGMEKFISDFTKARETPEDPRISTLTKKLIADIEGSGNRGADQLAAEKEQGVQAKKEALTAVQGKIKQLEAEFQAYSLDQQGKPITMASIQGSVAAKRNAIAGEMLMLQSQAMLLTGQYNDAVSAASRSVDLKYLDVEQKIKNQAVILDLYKDEFNAKEKVRAEAVQEYLKQQAVLVAEQKAEAKQQASYALKQMDTYKSAGIQITDDYDTIQRKAQSSKEYQMEIQSAQADIANTRSLTNERLGTEGDGSGVSGDLAAYAAQYASNGTLPSPSELKLAGLTAGMVANAALELPKAPGTLVDVNTGIKSKALSPAQEDGIIALKDLTQKLDDLKKTYNETGLLSSTAQRQKYVNQVKEITDLLARARTGAAITEYEQTEYAKKLPQLFGLTQGSLFRSNRPSVGNQKIDDLKSSLGGKLDTVLKTQGVSIYGYSEVNVGGQKFKVGDIINNGSTDARVNPNGSLTPINSNGGPTSSSVTIPPSSRLSYVNNNPGNLRFAGQPGAVQGQGGFAKFSSAVEGFNALIRQIKLDASRGLSLSAFINKFAPPSENDTKTYISQIASALKTKSTTLISKLDINKLAKAIAKKESGTNIT